MWKSGYWKKKWVSLERRKITLINVCYKERKEEIGSLNWRLLSRAASVEHSLLRLV